MNANNTIPGTCRLLRIREVLQLCGLSRATLYREIKLHSFPAPVKLSARSVGWLQDDVMHWMETRIEQRGPAYHEKSSIDDSDTKTPKKFKSGPNPAQDESK